MINIPLPGTLINTTSSYNPAVISAVKIHSDNPLKFNFLVNVGDEQLDESEFNDETLKLIKYFLAALTISEDKQWVNLSPYEKDRIIPEEFGKTEMGRDLLAQDYILKQLTSSLMYPENDLGAYFWDKIYEKAKSIYGVTDIPVDTFNKVWIVPDKAVVYEHKNTAIVVSKHLKVMLEDDYFAFSHNQDHTIINSSQGPEYYNKKLPGTEIIKQIIIPEIEREVNEGKTFSTLRQIYNSMILAVWYKKKIKESLLSKVYVNKNKTKGVLIENPNENLLIYEKYLEAFNKGIYDYIKEDYDPETQQIIPRKYFSGGADMGMATYEIIEIFNKETIGGEQIYFSTARDYEISLISQRSDTAMLTKAIEDKILKNFYSLKNLDSVEVNKNITEINQNLEYPFWIEEITEGKKKRYIAKRLNLSDLSEFAMRYSLSFKLMQPYSLYDIPNMLDKIETSDLRQMSEKLKFLINIAQQLEILLFSKTPKNIEISDIRSKGKKYSKNTFDYYVLPLIENIIKSSNFLTRQENFQFDKKPKDEVTKNLLSHLNLIKTSIIKIKNFISEIENLKYPQITISKNKDSSYMLLEDTTEEIHKLLDELKMEEEPIGTDLIYEILDSMAQKTTQGNIIFSTYKLNTVIDNDEIKTKIKKLIGQLSIKINHAFHDNNISLQNIRKDIIDYYLGNDLHRINKIYNPKDINNPTSFLKKRNLGNLFTELKLKDKSLNKIILNKYFQNILIDIDELPYQTKENRLLIRTTKHLFKKFLNQYLSLTEETEFDTEICLNLINDFIDLIDKLSNIKTLVLTKDTDKELIIDIEKSEYDNAMLGSIAQRRNIRDIAGFYNIEFQGLLIEIKNRLSMLRTKKGLEFESILFLFKEKELKRLNDLKSNIGSSERILVKSALVDNRISSFINILNRISKENDFIPADEEITLIMSKLIAVSDTISKGNFNFSEDNKKIKVIPINTEKAQAVINSFKNINGFYNVLTEILEDDSSQKSYLDMLKEDLSKKIPFMSKYIDDLFSFIKSHNTEIDKIRNQVDELTRKDPTGTLTKIMENISAKKIGDILIYDSDMAMISQDLSEEEIIYFINMIFSASKSTRLLAIKELAEKLHLGAPSALGIFNSCLKNNKFQEHEEILAAVFLAENENAIKKLAKDIKSQDYPKNVVKIFNQLLIKYSKESSKKWLYDFLKKQPGTIIEDSIFGGFEKNKIEEYIINLGRNDIYSRQKTIQEIKKIIENASNPWDINAFSFFLYILKNPLYEIDQYLVIDAISNLKNLNFLMPAYYSEIDKLAEEIKILIIEISKAGNKNIMSILNTLIANDTQKIISWGPSEIDIMAELIKKFENDLEIQEKICSALILIGTTYAKEVLFNILSNYLDEKNIELSNFFSNKLQIFDSDFLTKSLVKHFNNTIRTKTIAFLYNFYGNFYNDKFFVLELSGELKKSQHPGIGIQLYNILSKRFYFSILDIEGNKQIVELIKNMGSIYNVNPNTLTLENYAKELSNFDIKDTVSIIVSFIDELFDIYNNKNLSIRERNTSLRLFSGIKKSIEEYADINIVRALAESTFGFDKINFYVRKTDSAMTASDKNLGGIDFNSINLDLEIKHDANIESIPLNNENITNFQIEGFLPVIINISPAANIHSLLGFSINDDKNQKI